MKKVMSKLAALGFISLLSISVNAATLNANEAKESGLDIVKVKDVMPVYPSSALSQKKQGYVVLSYDLNKEGVPVNIKVMSVKGTKRFVRPSVKALGQTRFEPVMANNEAVEVVGLQKQYDFIIDGEKDLDDIPGLIAFNL